MKEVISVYVGQAGVRIGEACWQLYCLEHGIEPDGTMPSTMNQESTVENFFSKSDTGKYVARSIMVDLDTSVLDEVRGGLYRKIFNPVDLISANDNAANNFARGHDSVGPQTVDIAVDRIRRHAEACDGIQAFMFFHSVGGGTGSGLTSLLMERLATIIPHKSYIQLAIYPSPRTSVSVMESYNAVLATDHTLDYTDCSFVLDNDALFRLCQSRLNFPSPGYRNVNYVISQAVSSLTASHRLSSSLYASLPEIETNLCPYPRLHYSMISYAPINAPEEYSVQDITKLCFHTSNQMLSCHPRKGKYIGMGMLYRGDVTLKDVNASIEAIKVKKRNQFVNWYQDGYKVGINTMRPMTPNGDIVRAKRALCMLSNTTAIGELWDRILNKFDLLYSRRAFVHFMVSEGMEEGEFKEARENVANLAREYHQYNNIIPQVKMDNLDEELNVAPNTQ